MPTLARAPGVRPLLLAETAGSVALSVSAVALPWLVLTTGGSANQVGALATAGLLPMLVLGIPLGAVVSRVGARRWLVASATISALLSVGIAVWAVVGTAPFPALLAAQLVFGALRTPSMAGMQDALAELLDQHDALLARATSILQGVGRTGVMLGPPAAGGLIAALGPGMTYGVVGLVHLLSGLTLLLFVPPVRAPRRPESPPRLLDGLNCLRADRVVRLWVGASAFSEPAYQALFVAIPVLTISRFDGSAVRAGLLLGGFGGGAALGSLAAALLAGRVRTVDLALAGKLTQLPMFALLVLPLPFPAAVGVLVGLGLANGLTGGPASAVQLPRLDPAHRGSALTAGFTLTMGSGALGAAVAGPVLDRHGGQPLFLVTMALMTISCALFLAGAVPARRQARDAADVRPRQPAPHPGMD